MGRKRPISRPKSFQPTCSQWSASNQFWAALFRLTKTKPGNRVVILSHGLWQRRFGGDPAIVGKSVRLNGEQFQVIGVMPAGFVFPISASPPEVWTSMSILREANGGAHPMTEQRGNDFLKCVARLKSNISIAQAQVNMDTISAALRQQYPDSNTNIGVKICLFLRRWLATRTSLFPCWSPLPAASFLASGLTLPNLLLRACPSCQKKIRFA